jgi:hypothetical protein
MCGDRRIDDPNDAIPHRRLQPPFPAPARMEGHAGAEVGEKVEGIERFHRLAALVRTAPIAVFALGAGTCSDQKRGGHAQGRYRTPTPLAQGQGRAQPEVEVVEDVNERDPFRYRGIGSVDVATTRVDRIAEGQISDVDTLLPAELRISDTSLQTDAVR